MWFWCHIRWNHLIYSEKFWNTKKYSGKEKKISKQKSVYRKLRISRKTPRSPQSFFLFFSGRKWLAVGLEVRYNECTRIKHEEKMISYRSTNVSFRKYLPKIKTGTWTERSMIVIKQKLSVWRNRGKGTEVGEIRNRTLEELSVWWNREKWTKVSDVMNQMLMWIQME